MMAAIIDTVIIVLLVGSISYGYLVSRKVQHLMRTLKDLEPLVDAFSTAVDKSEYSVVRMRENIEEVRLKQRLEAESEELEEEITFFSRSEAATKARDVAGLRVVRDKKELVRAFFENSSTAQV